MITMVILIRYMYLLCEKFDIFGEETFTYERTHLLAVQPDFKLKKAISFRDSHILFINTTFPP